MAGFIEGRKQGRKEPGALGGSTGAHGQPREEAQDSEAALQGLSGHGCPRGSVGEPLGSPHHCSGPSHNALPAQHLMGTATLAIRVVLVPRQGLKAANACADQETKQREQWVCSGCSQRGMGRVQKS